MNITKLSQTTFSHPTLSQRYLKLQNHAFISHSIFFLNIHPFSHPHFSDIHLTGCLFCNNVVFCAITKACHTNISKFFLQLNCQRSHNTVNAFFFLIRNKRYVNYDKKYKRRMRSPPHKIQITDHNKTKHLQYRRRNIHKGIHKSPQDQTQLLSMLSTPFELETKSQQSWITLSGTSLNATVQEAHKEK